ncbi:hypothetical protein [Candidatus Sodalis sp. SoCistrobi]|uniref:hypothetical protein n=1 Tax=Candidatus Sodalis sp. SoCistrobi TaxID=1922216 RepID=UPI000B2CDA37|nr:hypothetical protein [Candidatus Sodalis sp. SoCistrobi]
MDKMPATDIKALRHLLGFIRMIDNSPPELRSQFSLEGRFRQGRISVRLSYDDTVIREVSLTEEAFGLLNSVFTVDKRGAMIYDERAGNGRAGGKLEARFIAACEKWLRSGAGKTTPPEGQSHVEIIHLTPWRDKGRFAQGLRGLLEGVTQQRY